MAILSDIGYHIQLTHVDSQQNEKLLFPTNTSDNVIIDETGTSLTQFIPTVVDNVATPTKKAPLTGVEQESIQISDAELAALNA